MAAAEQGTPEEEAAEEEAAEEDAKPKPKRGAKPKPPKPPAPRCRGCGCENDRGEAYCWTCKELHSGLVTKLVVEAFAQGHELVPGVALAFDWADAALAERAARIEAGADLRGGT